jgi:hypothetical protein
MAINPQAHTPGYEKTDANPRGLLYFAIFMAGILALAFLSMRWLFGYFQKAENPGSFVAAPFAGVRPLPPPPRIQPNPAADIQDYFQSQQNLLNTYGWIDRQNGIVRLPIDRAMELLLERGLPTRTTVTAEKGVPTQKRNRAQSRAAQEATSAAQEGGALR